MGLDGGEADDGEHIGGEGAGLALGLRDPPPPFFQRGAYPTILARRFVAGPFMRFGDGGGGQRMVAMLAPSPARTAR